MEGTPSEDAPASGLDDDQLLACALDVAARFGDPAPDLIRTARGTRHDVNLAINSGRIPDDTPSCVFVMHGNFRWSHSRPPHPDREITEQDITYEYLHFVLDVSDGRLMDVGARHRMPDLRALGDLQPPAPGYVT